MLPKGFKMGFSEAGFQFEMGISDVDSKSDWYKWTHDKANIEKKLSSGDLPENGPGYWDLYQKDHDLAKSIGMNSARIGIEWSRIFPESTEEVEVNAYIDGSNITGIKISETAVKQLDKLANKEAVSHYENILLDARSKLGNLVINLYHWTSPIWINDPSKNPDGIYGRPMGGCFELRQRIEFAKYAAYVAWKLGKYADSWTTMNEPNMVFLGCSEDITAEGVRKRKRQFAEAHARAYDAIKQFSDKPVGIIYANGDMQPLTEDDRKASEMMKYVQRFSFFDAIVNGNMSGIVESKDGDDNHRSDFKGKVDWIGVNYYSRDVVKTAGDLWEPVQGYGYACANMEKSLDGRSVSEVGWEVYPEGIYNLIMDYHKRYGLRMMITENGLADLTDSMRPRYLVSHIYHIERACREGANVDGYYHWALTDNYEWANGFRMRFGLFGVDYNTKERMLRPSALVFREIAKNNGVPDNLMWMTKMKI